MQRLLNRKQVAGMLGVSESTVKRLVSAGHLAAELARVTADAARLRAERDDALAACERLGAELVALRPLRVLLEHCHLHAAALTVCDAEVPGGLIWAAGCDGEYAHGGTPAAAVARLAEQLET